jgi:tight adherence protein C
MLILLLIGLALVVLSVALALRAVNISRLRSTEMVETIDAYGFSGRTESVLVRSGDSTRRTVDDLVSRIGGFVTARMSTLSSERMRRELIAAGMYTTTPRKFAGYRVISAVGIPAFVIWILSTSGLSGLFIVVGCAFAVVLGLIGPRRIVVVRAKRRQTAIDYQLPDLIDLLVVTVEAGVSFTGALRVASQRVEGELGEELKLTLQEQEMGLSANEALVHMLDRVETPGMRSFVRSVLQGETLGVSIGQIMRNLAVEMRKRRRAKAEERAQKAPIKILFPLVFMIFPAIFVIILAPAVYALLDAFHK